MRHKHTALASLIAAAFALPGLASANTLTDTATLSVEVNSKCTITAEDVDWGLYTGSSSSDDMGAIRVICNEGQVYTLGLSAGLSGDEEDRQLYLYGQTANEESIPYFIRQNQTNTNWGDTNPADRVSAEASGYWTTHSFRIGIGAPSIRYAPGSYSDTLRATVYW